jgi:hypothetical protein
MNNFDAGVLGVLLGAFVWVMVELFRPLSPEERRRYERLTKKPK